MTIIDTRGEVTTSQVIEALQLPPDPVMFDAVRRFGFEYEMLRNDDRGYDDDCRCEDGYYDEDDEWHDSYTCDFCNGARRGSDEVGRLIQRAYDARMIGDTYQHAYHCDCSDCRYDRSGPLMTAQEDCTCGVEFVSRILDTADFTQWSDDVDKWVSVFQQWKKDGNWMPDGHYANGNHVHVSCTGDRYGNHFADSQIARAHQHIDAIYAIFHWNDIADGGCGALRAYNRKPGTHDYGNWVERHYNGTFEHRLWNTPRDPERLWAHLGLSIGITRWAFNIAVNMPDFAFKTRRVRTSSRYYGDSYTDAITDTTFQEVTDNKGELVRGIRAYIPSPPQFDIARDLICNLS